MPGFSRYAVEALTYTGSVTYKNSHSNLATQPDSSTRLKAFGPGLAAVCLFIALGCCFIPLAGIQNDEALFASPLYQSNEKGLWIPSMVMNYLGSLKAYLLWPVLSLFGANLWSVRLPMVLMGALSIFLFYNLTKSSGGRLAAVSGALLLATDPLFLLTHTFDWGPVALEILLMVTGCWALYHFGSRNGPKWQLAAGFFCFGLALWNKALFAWALTGLVAGALLVFWPEIRGAASRRNLAIAGAAFLFGAAPLLVYNLRHDLATFRENSSMDTAHLGSKWIQVASAVNGNSLFGYVVAQDSAARPKAPADAMGRAADWIHERFGTHRNSGFWYVLVGLLLAVPLWWRSRAARFSLVFFATGWLMMALTRDAGGSAHHVILLWPFPILFAAAALARIRWKFIPIGITTGVICMNLLVLNQYRYQFARFGAGDTFTDALTPLAHSLKQHASDTIYITDWGMFDSINLLHQGRLTLRFMSGSLSADAPSEAERLDIERMLHDPKALIVLHVPEREVFPNIAVNLDRALEAAGYRKSMVQAIADSNGRAVFEVFRVEPR
jgi:hypothetical protein